MSRYEVTLIVRNMLKPNLVETLKRCGTTLMNHGAIIRNMQSLGHRDLPFRMIKSTPKQEYTGHYFLFDCYLPNKKVGDLMGEMHRDSEILRNSFVKMGTFPAPPECTLEEELRPPPERHSVLELRKTQKMAPFARRRAFQAAERAYRYIPKSFTIATKRK